MAGSLAPAAWDEIVPAERIRGVVADEALLVDAGRWVEEFWARGHSRGWYLLQTGLLHPYGHWFDAMATRRAARRSRTVGGVEDRSGSGRPASVQTRQPLADRREKSAPGPPIAPRLDPRPPRLRMPHSRARSGLAAQWRYRRAASMSFRRPESSGLTPLL